MKQIPISGNKYKGKYLLVDDDDYEEMSKYSWYITAGGYPSAVLKAHQMALKMYARKGQIIDHINCDPLDNRKSNLRIVTHQQNMQNKKIDSRNKTGYKGVIYRPKNAQCPYVAFIGNGKKGSNTYLGAFETAELAAKAYDKEARIRFGEYGKPNFPEDE